MSRRYAKNLPSLWLVTDERVAAETLLASATRLPRGRAGILFRHYRTERRERRALFERLRAIARRRRLVLLVAGSERAREPVREWDRHKPRPPVGAGWRFRGGSASPLAPRRAR